MDLCIGAGHHRQGRELLKPLMAQDNAVPIDECERPVLLPQSHGFSLFNLDIQNIRKATFDPRRAHPGNRLDLFPQIGKPETENRISALDRDRVPQACRVGIGSPLDHDRGYDKSLFCGQINQCLPQTRFAAAQPQPCSGPEQNRDRDRREPESPGQQEKPLSPPRCLAPAACFARHAKIP